MFGKKVSRGDVAYVVLEALMADGSFKPMIRSSYKICFEMQKWKDFEQRYAEGVKRKWSGEPKIQKVIRSYMIIDRNSDMGSSKFMTGDKVVVKDVDKILDVNTNRNLLLVKFDQFDDVIKQLIEEQTNAVKTKYGRRVMENQKTVRVKDSCNDILLDEITKFLASITEPPKSIVDKAKILLLLRKIEQYKVSLKGELAGTDAEDPEYAIITSLQKQVTEKETLINSWVSDIRGDRAKSKVTAAFEKEIKDVKSSIEKRISSGRASTSRESGDVEQTLADLYAQLKVVSSVKGRLASGSSAKRAELEKKIDATLETHPDIRKIRTKIEAASK